MENMAAKLKHNEPDPQFLKQVILALLEEREELWGHIGNLEQRIRKLEGKRDGKGKAQGKKK